MQNLYVFFFIIFFINATTQDNVLHCLMCFLFQTHYVHALGKYILLDSTYSRGDTYRSEPLPPVLPKEVQDLMLDDGAINSACQEPSSKDAYV